MLGMFYKKQMSKSDRNQAIVLRRQMEKAPEFKGKFYDDTASMRHLDQKENASLQDAVEDPNTRLLTELRTNLTMSTARFIRFLQEIEIKYGDSFDDRLEEIDADGVITFHLNNIDGWHP